MNLYYLQVNTRNFWVWGIAVISVLALVLAFNLAWYPEEKREPEKTVSSSSPARRADQKVEGFFYQELKENQKQFELMADVAEVYNQEHLAVLKMIEHPVEARSYTDKGPVTLYAREMTYNLLTKDAEARGDVLVVAEEGKNTLSTQSLQWIAILAKVKTKDPVTINREGLHITGTGMEADTNLENVLFYGRTETTFRGSGAPIFTPRK